MISLGAAFTLLAAASLGGACSVAAAQDSHYATHLYGDRSTLLGGGVIASVDDASAAYYNPGALADVAAKDVFLGTKVFDATRITVIRSAEEELRIDSDNIGKSPSFVGGMIPIRSEGHRFAYSLLKRASFGLRMTGTDIDAAISPTQSDYSSDRLNRDFDASLNEDWLGLSWAYAPSENTRIGITNFFSYRSHRMSNVRSTEYYRTDGSLRTVMLSREYRYTYLSVLWKLGVKQHVNDRLVLGASFTTPGVGLGIFSDGKAGASSSLSGSDGDSEGQTQDIFIAVYQKGLGATYKSPMSVGVGAAYSYSNRTIHASAELFGSQASYDVLDLDPFVGQSSGDTLDLQVAGGAESVFNVGIGLEEHLSTSFDMFFGFHTDFSAAPKEIPGSISVTRWDLFHLNGGSQFSFGAAQITLGIGYAFGSQKLDQLLPDDEILPVDTLQESDSTVHFNRLKLIVGFGVRT